MSRILVVLLSLYEGSTIAQLVTETTGLLPDHEVEFLVADVLDKALSGLMR